MNTKPSDELYKKIKAYQYSSYTKGYDDSVEVLKELEQFLLSALQEQPNNVNYVCYLASAKLDLRNHEDVSIKILRDFLETYQQHLTNDDKARIHTNIAYYYNDYGDKRELVHLKIAEQLHSNYHQTYYAMGLYYNEKEDYELSAQYFLNALNLHESRDYIYNYATALFKRGHYAKAKELFLTADITHEETLLSLAKCTAKLGEKTESIQYLQQIERRKSKFENIDEYDIATVCYEMGEYSAYYEVFTPKKNGYYIDNMFDYFYVLFILKKEAELKHEIQKVLAKKQENLAYYTNKEITEDYSYETQQEDIATENEELAEFISTLDKIQNEGYRPASKLYMFPVYGCYLIDCVLHS